MSSTYSVSLYMVHRLILTQLSADALGNTVKIDNQNKNTAD